MKLLPFRSVFSKLFASVMLALILFAIAMIFLTKVLQGNNNSVRSEILAGQVVEQINPFLIDLHKEPDRLQSRFMLAIIKKSFDIFDQSLDAKMGLYNRNGRLLVQTDGSDLSKQLSEPPSWFAQTFPTLAGVSPTTSARVVSPTGYTLFFEPRRSPKHNALTAMFNIFTGTLLLLAMMAIALWWIARSMTWRINQMSKQMQQLGEGDFDARVKVSGDDEITTLAKGFNQSAEKIQNLINANNLLLAHASHEFRTPITRIRLQVEMMDMIAATFDEDTQEKFMKRANAITRDLTGLNDLVESILLVSRLDAGHALQKAERIDLFELIQQEVQHFPEASLYGEQINIQGQSKLLTHLVRNLLNNAMIHGIPPVTIFVYGTDEDTAENIPSNLIESMAVENVADTDDNESDEGEDSIAIQLNDNKTNNETETNQPAHVDTSNMALEPVGKKPKLGLRKPKKPRKRLRQFIIKSKSQVQQTEDFVAIAIIDQGDGIPIEKRQDIFSPFVRLKQEKKGSGLGLSLVAQIVDSHNGTITTDTWQGHTRFLITLPTKSGFKNN